MSNIPLYVALVGVVVLIYGILKDVLFASEAIVLTILGIIVGVLIAVLATGDV